MAHNSSRNSRKVHFFGLLLRYAHFFVPKQRYAGFHEMTYEMFFAGAGGAALGALLAAWLSYRFQRALLRQQLDFQKKLHEEVLAFQRAQAEADAQTKKAISEATQREIHDAAMHLKTALGAVGRRIDPS